MKEEKKTAKKEGSQEKHKEAGEHSRLERK